MTMIVSLPEKFAQMIFGDSSQNERAVNLDQVLWVQRFSAKFKRKHRLLEKDPATREWESMNMEVVGIEFHFKEGVIQRWVFPASDIKFRDTIYQHMVNVEFSE